MHMPRALIRLIGRLGLRELPNPRKASAPPRTHTLNSRLIALATVTLLAVVPSALAGKPGSGGGGCGRKCPVVSIVAPATGATVQGTVSVSGTASDSAGVAKVEVSVDGAAYQAASGTASWSFPLNTGAYPAGSHAIAARATDTAGNATATSVSVMFVDTTPPVAAVSAPSAGATVSGTVAMAGSAADNTGVAKVEVRVDGGAYEFAQGTTSWAYSLDTTRFSDGAHTLAARATDMSGNVASTSRTVNVQNSAFVAAPVPAPAMASGTIGGYAFKDADRDGVYRSDEQPLANERLFLYTDSGTYIGNAVSDASGWYQFTGLTDGSYRAQFAPASWWDIRHDWVPDTTGSIFPRRDVRLSSAARADFGWRPVVRSTDASSPLSSFVGPNGLKVQSYDDVVAAKDVYDRLMTGLLVGPEAQFVTIRFDYQTTSVTSTMAASSNGVYIDYHATSFVDYDSWLDGDGALFHEYGHAWSLYCAYMVQQDPKLTAYLQARGLLGDSRLGASYPWDPKEMIAEDYRQLFGTPTARSVTQMNRDIPPAADVPGLKDFLANVFTTPPAS
jgi:hypothetical protein